MLRGHHHLATEVGQHVLERQQNERFVFDNESPQARQVQRMLLDRRAGIRAAGSYSRAAAGKELARGRVVIRSGMRYRSDASGEYAREFGAAVIRPCCPLCCWRPCLAAASPRTSSWRRRRPRSGRRRRCSRTVAPFVELTGNTQAFNTVDLVARVEGFLRRSTTRTAPPSRRATSCSRSTRRSTSPRSSRPRASSQSTKALLVQAQAEFPRQETLLRQDVSAQNTYDTAKAKRDRPRRTSTNSKPPGHGPDQSRLHQGRRRRSTASSPTTWSRSASWSAPRRRPSSRPSSSSIRSTSPST